MYDTSQWLNPYSKIKYFFKKFRKINYNSNFALQIALI